MQPPKVLSLWGLQQLSLLGGISYEKQNRNKNKTKIALLDKV